MIRAVRRTTAGILALTAWMSAGGGSDTSGESPDDPDAFGPSAPICPTTLAYDLTRPDPNVLADALRTYVPTAEEARIAAGYWAFLSLAVERGEADEALAATNFISRLSEIAGHYPQLFSRDCEASALESSPDLRGGQVPGVALKQARRCGEPCPVQADVAGGLTPELAAGVDALSQVTQARDLQTVVKDVAKLLRGECGQSNYACDALGTGAGGLGHLTDALSKAILQTVGEAILGVDNLEVVHDLLGYGHAPPTTIVEAEGTIAALIAQSQLAPVIDRALSDARACANEKRKTCTGDDFSLLASEGGMCAQLLAAFRPWKCPDDLENPSEPLQMPRTSSMICFRDTLVDAAVQACWGAECQARHGNLCPMLEDLDSANKSLCEAVSLCSDSVVVGSGDFTCDTAAAFPCPASN